MIVVVEKNDMSTRSAIRHIIQTQTIKLGTTVFSTAELLCGDLDAKTIYALYKMKIGAFYPLMYSSDLALPHYSIDQVSAAYRANLPNTVHSLRRSLYVEAFYCACSCAVTSCPCDCMSDAVLIVGSGNVLSNGYLATANCEIGVRV